MRDSLRQYVMKKALILIALLPIAIFIGTILLMEKEHTKHPDKLSCSSFKSTLRKHIPLYTAEKSFNVSTSKICECFSQQNPTNEKMGFVTQSSLDKCAKAYIQEWSIPHDKKLPEQQKICLKNKIYAEASHLILLNQKEAHSTGLFKNDLFKYGSPIDWNGSIKSCSSS